MKRVIILVPGNPFRKGTDRERCWSLLRRCRTDWSFVGRFRDLNLKGTSITASNYLIWVMKSGHARLE